MSKVDFIFSSLRYRDFKISVFFNTKKLKVAKFGKLNLTKPKNKETI